MTHIFSKYSSITNHYDKKFIEKIKLSPDNWIVTEKIHGANFSFIVNRDLEVRIASRTSLLDTEQNFMGSKSVVESYKDRVAAAAKYIFEGNEFATCVQFVGELFGGSYPHPDVKKDNTATRVQKEVSYCPHNDWVCFDIITTYTILDKESKEYMNARHVHKICYDYQIPQPPIIDFDITLEKALQMCEEFPTRIPYRYGLPEIEGNVSEGIVIKPIISSYIGQERIIIKKKGSKFTEKKSHKSPQPEKHTNESLLNDIDQYITDSRLSSVVSKIGEISMKDFGKVLSVYVEDVIIDYEKEYSTIESKDDRKMVNKHISAKVVPMIKKYLMG